MAEQLSPKAIKDAIEAGLLKPEQAAEIFAQAHKKPTAVTKPTLIFIHNKDAQHYFQRQDLEETVRHWTGMVAVAIVGLGDGVIDGVLYGVDEVVESLAFGVSRGIKRASEGWQRGKI